MQMPMLLLIPQNTAEYRSEAKLIIPGDLTGLNVQDGLMRVGGKKSLYLSIIEKMSKNYINAENDLLELISNAETAQAQRYAHSLKGVAGNVGAVELMQAAARLEQAFKDDEQELKPYISDLSVCLSEVIASIHNLIMSNQHEKSLQQDRAPGDTAELKTLLIEIEPYIKLRKPKKCDEIIAIINERSWSDEYRESITELTELLSRYQFKMALDKLDTLLKKL